MDTLSVLMIEDDLDFAQLLKLRLESWGHKVTVTQNWLAMMMIVKCEPFDVVIVDVETPTGNGLTAFEFLTDDQAVREMPKVFVTGLNDAETVRRCYDINAHYIHKSANVFEQLETFLATVCDGEAVSGR